jgi:alkylhydroperoxidase family enzyme
MPRLRPLDAPFDPEVGDLLRRMTPVGVEPLALFRLFARNPVMAEAMHPWGRYTLGRQFTLSLREREIVIDRTCARAGCEYEWGVHVAGFAERAGLTGEQVRSLTHGGPGDRCWDVRRERLLIEAVDSLHDVGDLDDACWARLATAFSEPELIDLLLVTGWYHAISYVARAARLTPEPWAPRFADVTRADVTRADVTMLT